ncbi:MAG: hypothetical protein OEZ36_02545 [Spirochaetota bacterium]|nr:hypothetical protein [Spirochaetota bacterium]
MTDLSFKEIYLGSFRGMTKEESYIQLTENLTGTWYSFEPDSDLPHVTEIPASELKDTLVSLANIIKARKISHITHPYTYVHQPEDPLMIKLYDPRRGGSSCSIQSPPPWYLFSRVPPAEAELKELFPHLDKKPGFLAKLFKK